MTEKYNQRMIKIAGNNDNKKKGNNNGWGWEEGMRGPTLEEASELACSQQCKMEDTAMTGDDINGKDGGVLMKIDRDEK